MTVDADQPVFFYDLGSPYAYLAAERIGRLLPRAPLAADPPGCALQALRQHVVGPRRPRRAELLVAGRAFFADDQLEAAADAASS